MAIMGFCSAQMPSCLTVLSLIVISCLGLSVEVGASSANSSSHDAPQCQDGLIIPMWRPFDNLSIGDRIARGLVYFVAMCYLFVGVSIIADRFMASIEVITSKEKEITLKRPNGDKQIIVVRVWNETVANLTLMALGSSAPEILLSIIEVYAKDFEAGELGPGTIVGSAAFNLFMIIGLCVYVIPDGESRKIKHLRVFFVTATWSVFAYVWLYIILAVTSYGVVDVWESVLTFLFFPATVITAYIADRRMLVYKYLSKNYRMNRRGMIVQTEGGENKAFEDVELTAVGSNSDGLKVFDEEVNEEVREFEEHRRQYIQLLRDLRKQNPNLDMRSLEAMAREQLANSGPKSRAYYRIQATRRLTGGSSLNKKAFELTHSDLSQIPSSANQVSPVNENVIRIFFDPGHYTVMENVGEFQVTVKREGGDAMQVVMVDYRTEDGTANAGSDYVAVQGTLTFGPGETTKVFGIRVIDDDVFEEDEHFYVRLSNARLGPKQMEVTTSVNGSTGHHSTSTSTTSGPFNGHKVCQVELVAPFAATVMILDDDHCGVFNVAEKDHELVESVGVYELKVTRWSGARGRVAVPFATKEGTAKPSKDYEHTEGEIVFENNEIEKTIPIQILEEDSYEKDVLFYVQIGEPRHLSDVEGSMQNYDKDHLSDEERVALQGKPRLGDITIAQIRVKESKEFKNTVDKLVQRTNASILVGTSSWKEQFIEAITVSPDVDEDGEETMPSCGDYILHFLTVFWKILFAFVPPTEHMGGWLCFWVAIIWIGILTAIIGDVASAFGCSVGLKDSVTAIAFVALGTSVPDTFASKVSAVQDKYADASVGNVTGSNAVNVFLGIGIAWSIAAIYHAYHGRPFRVEPGNLAFSVTLFCSTAFIALTIMMLRRSKKVGGELGGPKCYKILTSLIFVFLWLFYVAMSSLEAYGYIQGF